MIAVAGPDVQSDGELGVGRMIVSNDRRQIFILFRINRDARIGGIGRPIGFIRRHGRDERPWISYVISYY